MSALLIAPIADPFAMVEIKDTYTIADGSFVCTWPNCHKKLSTAVRVYFHYVQYHQKQQQVGCPHNCTSNNNTFGTVQGLTYHIEAKHGGGLISCPVPGCSKASRQRGDILGHLRSKKHDIKLPVTDRKGAKKSQYYSQCKEVYQAWCQSQGFKDPDILFFDSIFETKGASRDFDSQHGVAGSGPTVLDKMETDLRADLRNLEVTAIADLFTNNVHHEHYVDYFKCNTNRLNKILGSEVLRAVTALIVLNWCAARHHYEENLLHDILITIKRLDLKSYDTLSRTLMEYKGPPQDTYYACVYGMYFMSHNDSLFLEFQEFEHVLDLFDREEDSEPKDELFLCQDECWLVHWAALAESEQGVTQYHFDAMHRWLENYPDTSISFFTLQHRNFLNVLLEDKTLLLTVLDGIHHQLDLNELTNRISARAERRKKFVSELQVIPAKDLVARTGYLFARAFSWYNRYPEVDDQIREHLISSYTQLSKYSSKNKVIQYAGESGDKFYQMIYGCYLSILVNPTTIPPRLLAQIVESFGVRQQKTCASHFNIWLTDAEAALKAAKKSDADEEALRLHQPLQHWLKQGSGNRDLLFNLIGTFVSPYYVKHGAGNCKEYVALEEMKLDMA